MDLLRFTHLSGDNAVVVQSAVKRAPFLNEEKIVLTRGYIRETPEPAPASGLVEALLHEGDAVAVSHIARAAESVDDPPCN